MSAPDGWDTRASLRELFERLPETQPESVYLGLVLSSLLNRVEQLEARLRDLEVPRDA